MLQKFGDRNWLLELKPNDELQNFSTKDFDELILYARNKGINIKGWWLNDCIIITEIDVDISHEMASYSLYHAVSANSTAKLRGSRLHAVGQNKIVLGEHCSAIPTCSFIAPGAHITPS